MEPTIVVWDARREQVALASARCSRKGKRSIRPTIEKNFMTRCEICGSAYPKALKLTINGDTQTFGCVKCAVQSLVTAMCPERLRHHRPHNSGARRIPLPQPLHMFCGTLPGRAPVAPRMAA
jgi:hypothetical protein